MDTKNLSLLFKTSLLAASMSMVVGCSENPIPVAETTTADVEKAQTDALIETLKDTKLSTIIISDPYANCDSVTVGGKKALKTNTPGKYTFAGDLSTTDENGTVTHKAIAATDCVDSITGAEIAAMETDENTDGGDGADSTTLSPITTMVKAAKDQLKLSDPNLTDAQLKQQAEQAVSTLTGVPVANLKDDPVTNPVVQKAAAKVVSMLNIARDVVSKANTDAGDDVATANTKAKTAMNEIFKNIIKESIAETKAGNNRTLDDKLADATFVEKTLPATAKAKAKSISATSKVVNESINSINDTDTGTSLQKIAAVAKTVKDSIGKKVASGEVNADDTGAATALATAIKNETDSAIANNANIIQTQIKAVEAISYIYEVSEDDLKKAAADPTGFMDDEALLEQALAATTNAAANAANELLQTACEAQGGVFNSTSRTCTISGGLATTN